MSELSVEIKQPLEYRIKKFWLGILANSLWVCGIALSIFSAGIDGAWLAKWQTWAWMGYAINFIGDITGEVMIYHFAKIQKTSRHGSPRWKASWIILVFAVIALLYSWLFSWRQLMTVMPDQPMWVPVVCATFVPMMLFAIGYNQAIVESKLEKVESKERRDYERELKRALAEQEKELRKEFADEYSSNRRAADEQSFEVMKRDGAKCFYCDADLTGVERDKIHIDHFVPVTKGGTDDLFNLVVSCARCNLSKNARMPTNEEVAKLKAHLIAVADLPKKDKVHLLLSLGLLSSQKETAKQLGCSASYVSSVLRNNGHEQSNEAAHLGERLEMIGLNGHGVEVN